MIFSTFWISCSSTSSFIQNHFYWAQANDFYSLLCMFSFFPLCNFSSYLYVCYFINQELLNCCQIKKFCLLGSFDAVILLHKKINKVNGKNLFPNKKLVVVVSTNVQFRFWLVSGYKIEMSWIWTWNCL